MVGLRLLAIDPAKGNFQAGDAGLGGTVLSNRAMPQARLAALPAERPACMVAKEACATPYCRGRAAQAGWRQPPASSHL